MKMLVAGVVVLCAVVSVAKEQRKVAEPCLVPDTAYSLPTSVIRAVMDSREAAFARKYFREQGKDPYRAAPLQGLPVRLTDSGGRAYLVGGSTPMTGADNRWYWLVQQTGQNARILLHVTTGCVLVSSKTSHGYRNVQTAWQVPGRQVLREYRFDGHAYQLHSEHENTE